jgi:hypothetical protein
VSGDGASKARRALVTGGAGFRSVVSELVHKCDTEVRDARTALEVL